MRRLLLASVVAALLSGCAAFLPEGDLRRPAAIGGTTVVVTFDRAPPELPFNPRGARLVAASQQLAVKVGHPVEIRLDAALLPQWAANFENALASGVENAVRGLAWMERTHPRAFAFAMPLFLRILGRYDAGARASSATFDDRTGTLSVTMPAVAGVRESVQARALAMALFDGFDFATPLTEAYYGPYLERRFAGVDAADAPPADLWAYWDYIERRRSAHYPRDAKSVRPDLADDPQAVEIEQVVRFWPRVPSSGPMADSVRRRLVEAARFFAYAYEQSHDKVRRAPPGSAFRHAEAAYSAWLNRHIDELGEAEQTEIVRAPIFPRTPLFSSHDRRPRFYEAAFPGFDRLGFALRTAALWIAAGHPAHPEVSDRRSIVSTLVCPVGRTSYGTLSHGGTCEGRFYDWIAETPTARTVLLHALVARRDTSWTETVVANLADGSTADLVEAWREVEPDAVAWRTATRALADPERGEADERTRTFYDEALRLWRQHPDRRGSVLYLLTSLGPYNLIRDGLVNWTDFDRIFGAKVSAAELTDYLGQGPLAISRAAGLWPALGHGFSRVAPLLPLLDDYLQDPNVKGYNDTAPDGPLRDIASRLCAEHATGDLALLHAYFARRAGSRPSEERRFGLILDLTSPGRCDATAKPGGLR